MATMVTSITNMITMFILKFTIMITREQMATKRRCCILVEGSPGYGKTTLARKIAADWGEKAGHNIFTTDMRNFVLGGLYEPL